MTYRANLTDQETLTFTQVLGFYVLVKSI